MKHGRYLRLFVVLLTVLVSLAVAAAVLAVNGGDWTHGGAQDEWEWGKPSFWPNTCNTGSTEGCWGTDLDSAYEPNANQDLFSPPIYIPLNASAPISVSWAHAWAAQQYGYDSVSASYRCGEGSWTQLFSSSNRPYDWRAAGPYRTFCQPGQTIQLKFNLTSNADGYTYAGYFVDDARVFDANGDIYFENFEPGADAPSYRQSRKTVSLAGQGFEGDTLTYTLSVVNSGGVAGNATLSDTMRAGLSYITGSAQLQGTGILTAPTAGAGGVLEWSGALDAGTRITITYRATVTAQSGYVDNTAVISDAALSAPMEIGVRSALPLASLTEDFEASTLPPYWEQENEGAGSADWQFVQASGTFYVNHDHTLGTSAGHIALVNDSYSDVTPPTNLLSPWLLPAASVEPELVFYHAGGSYGSGYTLHIDIITRTGEITDVLVVTGSGYNEWHRETVDLYPYRNQPFRIRFRGQTTDGWEQGLSMDDVSITQGLPELGGSFKTGAPAGLAIQGEPITYSLVLRNSGYGSGVVTVTDSIPAGTSYRAGSAQTTPPGYGTLTVDGSGITWTGPITRLSSVTVTFAVDVTGGGAITNTAVITAPTLSASVVISTVNRPPLPGLDEDFEHGGALPPGWFKNQAPGGEEYGWTFYTRDNSGAPWDHTTGSGYLAYVFDIEEDYSPVNLLTPFVDLRLFTHPVLEFYLWQTQSNNTYPHLSTLHVDLYDGFTWVNDVYTSAAVHVPWTRVKVDLLPYRARPHQIRFRVTDAGGETYSANVDIDDVRIQEARPTYDLSTKTVFPDHAQNGKPLTYTLVVANDDYVAGTLTLTDPYPAGTSYRAGSAQVTPPGGTLNTAGGALTWTGPVPARSSITVTFAVDVAGATPGGEIVNTATLTDPLAAETVTLTARTRVIQPAFNFCASFESGWPTMAYTRTTSVYNNSGRVALVTGYAHTGDYAARLAPTLNGGYVYQSAILAGNLQGQADAALTFWLRGLNTSTSGGGGVYASADDGLTYTKIYTFPTGTFAYQQIALDLDALLPTAGIPFSDKVLLKFQVYERYASYGYALDDVCLRGAGPDYSSSTKSAQSIAGVGQALTYTVVLRNSGDLDSAPTVTDTLPAAWPYIADSASASSGPAPVYADGKLTWSGTVAAGQAVTLTYAVTVASAGEATNAVVIHDLNALHGDLTRQATTRAYPAATLGTCVDFESGLPTTMFTQTNSSIYGYARAVVANTYPYAGSYALNLDTYRYGGNNTELTAAGVWVVNLKNVAQAQLTFWARRHYNEGYELDAADGVFISADGGATYQRIAQPTGSGYLYYTLDLDALAQANGLALGDGFLIKFQNYGNNAIPSEGFSYDNICLRAPVPKYDTSTKTASKDIIRAETPLTYTVWITNSGEITGSATLSDVIPAGATYIPGSATASSGAAPVYAEGTLTWSGEVPVGQNVTVRFAVTPTVGGTLTNTAVIRDPVAAAPVTVTRSVWVYKPASFPLTEDFEGGSMPTYGYNASVSNPPYDAYLDFNGTYAHSGAHALNLHGEQGGYTTPAWVLAVDLAGQTEVYLDFWLLAHQKWYDSSSGVYISDNEGATWSQIYQLPYNVTGYRKITLDLDALAATAGRALVDGFLIKFQARVDWTIPTCGYTFDDIAVRPAWPIFDVSRKTASRNLLATGATLTYTVVLSNSGQLSGTAVLSDPIPAGAAYIPSSAQTVPAGYGTLTDNDGVRWSGIVTAGQSVTVTFGVTITASAGVTVTNRAFIYNPTAGVTTTLQTQNYVRPAATFPTCLDFESGALPATMFAEEADSSSVVEVSEAYPHTGNYALDVARSSLSGYGRQAAVWMVNLANAPEAYLEFWVWEHDDYPNPTDGIYLSADGGWTYTKIYDLGNDPNEYVRKIIDLKAAATTAGLPLVDGMLIKLQGYSSTTMPNDGYSFDDICARPPLARYEGRKTASLPLSTNLETTLAQIGDVFTYTLVFTNTGELTATASISDPLPAALAYIPGTAQASSGVVTPEAGGIAWTGVITPATALTLTYQVSVTAYAHIINTAVITSPAAMETAQAQHSLHVLQPAPFPACEDFEDPASFASNLSWVTFGTRNGRSQGYAEVWDDYPFEGNYNLDLYTYPGGALTRQGVAILLDLDGATDAYLDFWAMPYNEEMDALPDAIFIGDPRGLTFTQVYTLPAGNAGYIQHIFDLDAAVLAAGRSLDEPFLVQFQSAGDQAWDYDGYALDLICARHAAPVYWASNKFTSRPDAAARVGVPFTYTIVVTNSGEVAGTPMVSDVLTAGLAYVGGTASSGPAPTYTPPQAVTGTGLITWTGSLAAGDSVTLTLVVSAADALVGSWISNEAVISDAQTMRPVWMWTEYTLIWPSSGGPDGFGYTYKDSYAPGGPVYNWIEHTAGATVLEADDFSDPDDGYAEIDLGFAFPFYAGTYTQAYVGTNGLLVFGGEAGADEPGSAEIPGAAPPNAFAACFWDDLELRGSGEDIRVETWGMAPNRYTAITWHVQEYQGEDIAPHDFQMVLYESDGAIQCQYRQMNYAYGGNGEYASIGLENATGDDGLEYSYASPVVEDGLAIRFNRPALLPVADAGADQTVFTAANVTLNGAASYDPDGGALTYFWQQTGGTAVTFTPNVSVTTFTAPASPDILTFTLTVTNAAGLSDVDTTVVTVTAPPVSYTLTIATAGNGHGILTPTVGAHEYLSGTVVVVTATAQPDSDFTGWSGACVGVSPTCTVTMDADKWLTATFTLKPIGPVSHTLTIATAGDGHGVVTPTVGAHEYLSGTVVVVTATAQADSTFAGWSGACAGLSPTCTVTMDANKQVTATFNLVGTCTPVSGVDFAFAPAAPVVGEPVWFTGTVAAGDPPLTYTWAWGDGTPGGSGTTLSHTFPVTVTAQTYSVTLTVSNPCPSQSSLTRPVTVQPRRIFLPLVLRAW